MNVESSFSTVVSVGSDAPFVIRNSGYIGSDWDGSPRVYACSSVDGGLDFDSTSARLYRSYPSRSSLVDIGSRFGPRPNGWVIEEDSEVRPGLRAFGRTRREALDDFCSKLAKRVADRRRVARLARKES